MMPGFFCSHARISALTEEVESWRGTPFLLNSRVKGKDGGVSCHNLMYGIYEGLGIDLDFESPRGTGGIGDQTRLSKISDFFRGLKQFEKVEPDMMFLKSGDLISFRVKTGEYHLGMMLPDRDGQTARLVHCIKPWGVTFASLHDPTYGGRIRAAFRLKHENEWS